MNIIIDTKQDVNDQFRGFGREDRLCYFLQPRSAFAATSPSHAPHESAGYMDAAREEHRFDVRFCVGGAGEVVEHLVLPENP